MNLRIILLFPMLFHFLIMNGQIVSIDPLFPTVNDEITVTFDATQGNGGLDGCSPVYMHTGVITQSGGPGAWQYVVGNWGVHDPEVLMEDIGDNKHQITFNIQDFYSFPSNEEVLELAFVFRNVDGSKEGKTSDNGDIFMPVYSNSSDLLMVLLQPEEKNIIAELQELIPIHVATSKEATINIYDNGAILTEELTDELTYNLEVTEEGNHTVLITVTDGQTTLIDSFHYVINPEVVIANPSADTEPGVNYINPNQVRLSIYAPFKEFVYVIGDFNNWQVNVDYFMKRSTDETTWWLDIQGLEPGQEYAFQYLVDGTLKIADPYSEKILDPWNDGNISSSTYPNLKPYPHGQTTGHVTVFDPGKTAYDWQVTDFEKPEKTDLVIYEMLLRDFLSAHDYATLLDTLDYLDRLGINAIELMPVNEFEGNINWGYAPSFHMALDKYYGPASDLKAFIDECHSRNITVILDVVYNHAFSQSPLCRLYWDETNFRPAPENPWFNVTATHNFNVGYDFNHESQATVDFVSRVMSYWLSEYRVDGFRLDLTKGFTQNVGGSWDVWAYDASRIAILKNYADVIWNTNPDAYVILEHFTENTEEKELSEYGMMIWGNGNCGYNQATMGHPNGPCGTWNFNGGVNYKSRGWADPHLIGYMESHDEERLMYKNLEFGNSSGDYQVMNLTTALKRIELGAAFFFTIPGPKMIWQFGELGYDRSLWTCPNGTVNTNDDGCKLSPKPILWDYQDEPSRNRLYHIHKSLIELKKNYDVFRTTDFSTSLSGSTRRINLNHSDMNVTVLGNFGVVPGNVIPNFQHTGWWYDYFSGDSILVETTNEQISLNPGEYHLYTDLKLSIPDIPVNSKELEQQKFDITIFPNPSAAEIQINFTLKAQSDLAIHLFDMTGQKISTLSEDRLPFGEHTITWSPPMLITDGMYLLEFKVNNRSIFEKIRFYHP